MGTRKPGDVWKALVDEAREDRELEQAVRDVEQMSPAQKTAALEEAGIDRKAVSHAMSAVLARAGARGKEATKGGPEDERPSRADEPELAMATSKGGGADEGTPDAGPGHGGRPRRPWWRRSSTLTAITLAAILVPYAAMNGHVLAAAWQGKPVHADDLWRPWKPSKPTPKQQAEALRTEALGDCAAQDWGACEWKLDAARDLDPDGEAAPDVLDARRKIAAHRPKEPDGDKLNKLRPTPP